MLKKFLFLTICLVGSWIPVFAQDTTKMLIKWQRPSYLGMYVAPEVQLGNVADEFAPMHGASAMLLIDKRLAIGLTGMRIQNSLQPAVVAPLYLRGGYGGMKLEYTPRPNGAVHVSFPITVGRGFLSADSTASRNGGGRDFDHDDHRVDDFGHGRSNRGNSYMVLAPGMNVEANLFRYGKIYLGAQYLFSDRTQASSTVVLPNYLAGFSFKIGAKLGLFDYYIGKKKTTEM